MDDIDHYSKNECPYISKSDKMSGPWPMPKGHQERMGEILKTTEVTHVSTQSHIQCERQAQQPVWKEGMMRHLDELMIGRIQDMRY